MNIGELRERVSIMKPATIPGPVSDLEPELIEHVTVWAKREDKIQEERWGGLAVNAVNKKQFIIRYREDITTDMFIRWKGKDLNILDSAELEFKRWTIILAGEVINSGL